MWSHFNFSRTARLLPIVLACCGLMISSGAVHAADELTAAVQSATGKVADSIVRIQIIGAVEQASASVKSQVTTGIVLDPSGYVLTSMFGFTTDPAAIFIQSANQQRQPAQLVARDHLRKLVLLKCDGLDVPPLPTREDRWPQVGEWAIALGRLYPTEIPATSVGIISAVGRIFDLAVQTDAKISPVNYGGPLVDLQGRAVGILVPLSPSDSGEQIRAGVEWYDSGIGFAIPMTDALQAAAQLKDGTDRFRGQLGLRTTTNNPLAKEVEVQFVLPDSPAATAGFQVGDQVVAVNGQAIDRFGTLDAVIKRTYAGESVSFEVRRGEETINLKAELVANLKAPTRGFAGVVIATATANETTDEDDGVEDDEDADPSDPSETDNENDADAGEANTDAAAGVKVFVLPQSPAATAGLPDEAWITGWNETDINAVADLSRQLRILTDGADIAVRFRPSPNEPEQTVQVKATKRPAEILPVTEPLRQAVVARAGSTQWEQREEKLGEGGRLGRVWFYAPKADPSQEQTSGMVVLLSAAETSRERLLEQWRKTCEDYNLILLVPANAEGVGLSREDASLLPLAIAAALPGRGLEVRRSVLIADAAQAELCTDLLLNPRLQQFRAALYQNSWPGVSGLPERLLARKSPSILLLPSPEQSRQAAALRGQAVQQLQDAGAWVLTLIQPQNSIEERVGVWTINLRAQ